MDGCDPEVGDSVHDILLGAGQIQTLFPNGDMRVHFHDGRTLLYTAQGHFGTVRRLYWENPVVVIPKRRENLISVLRDMAVVIRQDRLNRSP